jgi:hypothetical protein
VFNNKTKVMKTKIETSIIISGTPEQVWHVLMDFKSYYEWNPFIVNIKGKPIVGEQLEVKFEKMTFKPKVVRVENNHIFEWKGKLLFGGLFDGKHTFEIKKLDNNRVELIQKENFSGLLIPFMNNMIHIETKGNFIKMNEALKKRVEAIN